MRSGLDAATLNLLNSGRYDLHSRFRVSNGSGTLIDLSGRYTGGALSLPSPYAPIGSLTVDFIRETSYQGYDSLAPFVQVSTYNKLDDLVTYSPLFEVGRLATLDFALTDEGAARPSSGSSLWYEVFRGNIVDVNWPRRTSHKASLLLQDQAGFLKTYKSQAAYVYTAGTSIETAIQQVLNNNGFSYFTVNVPTPTGKVLSRDYAPGIQKTVWDQIWALAQSIGWVIWFRYVGNTPSLTLFEPARAQNSATFSVPRLVDFEQLKITGAEIGNVAWGVFTDLGGVRRTAGPVRDDASVAKYGGPNAVERPFWIVLADDSPVRTEADCLSLLSDALADTADPDAIAEGSIPANPFIECAVDLLEFQADPRFFDTPQLLAPFSATVQFSADAEAETVLQLRGRPSAGYRNWKKVSSVEAPPPTITIRPVPVDVGAGEDPRTHARVEISATVIGRTITRLDYATGSDALKSNDADITWTQANATGEPHTIAFSRATTDAADFTLLVRATASDGKTARLLWKQDFDSLPELSTAPDVRPRFDANGRQIGWSVAGAVDDDARSVKVTATGAVTIIGAGGGGALIVDTSGLNAKSYAFDVDQSAGTAGTLVITPYENSDGTGLAGPAWNKELSRPPITTHVLREETLTRVGVTLKVDPGGATVNWRYGVPDASGSLAGVPWNSAATTAGNPTAAFFVDRQSSDLLLEYYSSVAGVDPEAVHQLWIDSDSAPEVTAISLSQGDNIISAALTIDDDLTFWRLWARRGSYPTSNGLVDGKPDDRYLKHESTKDKLTTSFRADGTNETWYVMAQGFDFSGKEGPVKVASIVVSGSAPTDPELSSVAANPVDTGGGNYVHRLTWNNNSVIEAAAGGTYAVDVYRDGALMASKRDPKIDYDGTNPGASGGGWQENAPEKRVAQGSPGATYKTYTYDVYLFKPDGVGGWTNVTRYTLEITGYYLSPPSTAPTGLVLYESAPNETTVTWQNTSNTWEIEVAFEEYVAGNWQSVGGQDFLAPGSTSQVTSNWTNGQEIRCKLRYYNDAGDGPWSTPSNSVVIGGVG